jgi:ankyrin repeat protein
LIRKNHSTSLKEWGKQVYFLFSNSSNDFINESINVCNDIKRRHEASKYSYIHLSKILQKVKSEKSSSQPLNENQDILVKHLTNIDNITYSDKLDAFVISLQLHKFKIADFLLKKGVTLNGRASSVTILPDVAMAGDLEVAKYLVKRGVDVRASNNLALRNAVKFGQMEVAKYLIENGANVSEVGKMDLHRAKENGHIEMVKYIEFLLK